MFDIFVQSVGAVALICSLMSFQQNDRKNVMILQMTASLLFSAQLFLLGAVTGGCLDLISFVRTVIFSNNEKKKWAKSPVWLWLFVGIMIITGIVTWENTISLLAIAGSVLSTVALWMKTAGRVRIISLFVGPCWLVYNLACGAYTGAVNELIAMVSIIVGIIRYDIKFKKI